MKHVFRFHIAREQIGVLEDMIERCDLQGIIVVTWSSPANVSFEVCLSQIRKIKDLLFQIFHKTPVGFVAAYLQRLSYVFKKVHMAKLNDYTGVDSSRSHADGFIVIANECQKFVAGVLELGEELQQCLVVLAGSQHADGNIVRQVINAVDERNLLVVALHCDEFAIDDKEAAEAFGIAVGKRDLVVMRKSIQLCYETSVGAIRSFADVCSDRADTRALEMRQKNRLRFPSMIDGETFPAIIAEMPFQSIS